VPLKFAFCSREYKYRTKIGRGIDDAHILAEHGVNGTCRRNNLIFGRYGCDGDLA
jgi:hypothetical protein